MSGRALLPSSPFRTAGLLAAVLVCALAPGRAAGGFVARITPGSASLSAGGTQDFVVSLEADATTGPTDVTGFTVRLELSGAVGGVQFTAGAMPAAGYLFDGNSGGFIAVLGAQSPGGAFDPGDPALSITLSDFPDFPDTISITGPGSWVLGVVTVAADPTPAGGAVAVRFNRDYSGLDGATAPLDVAFEDATFQVLGTGDVTAVPAPGGLVLMATSAPVLISFARRRGTKPCQC